jgi:cytochrome c
VPHRCACSSPLPLPATHEREQIAATLCETGQRPQGGWTEYLFPKPGEQEPMRKLSYSKAAEGTPYVPTAGIYSEDVTLEELEQIIGN